MSEGLIMSTKEWVYQGNEKYALFQEMTLDSINNNPATLAVINPSDFKIEFETNAEGQNIGHLMTEIPAEIFDEIALAWCKQRKLHGALGGPVGNEWGSPDCEYK
jgi:hypothetical protein